MKKILTLLCFFSALHISASVPDWSINIAPIIYGKCSSCHHSGGIATFNLMSYSDVLSHAHDIKAAVNNRIMPPWPPDPQYRHLAHERILSQDEINAITAWADNGTPQGNTAFEPPPPTFSTDFQLPGTADLTIRIPNYTVTSSSDIYQCFVIPSGLVAARFISAFEVVPGNRSIVHHVLLYSDTTGACAALDAADPNPGYTHFGGVGSGSASLIGGWVPGSNAYPLPQGLGIRLAANADLVLQIHYPAGCGGQSDSTSIRFFFSPDNNVRNVSVAPVLNHSTTLINGPLNIPADSVKNYKETNTIPPFYGDLSLIGIGPHMHLLGQNIRTWLSTPSSDTIPLINIPRWDFHWQGFYQFQKVLKMPAGSTFWAEANFDNTNTNPSNPNNPPLDVHEGEATTDEMMIVFVFYMPYQTGDENIVIDTAAIYAGINDRNRIEHSGAELFSCMPNPLTQYTMIRYTTQKPGRIILSLIDFTGREIILSDSQQYGGYHEYRFEPGKLAAGVYFVRMQTEEGEQSKKLLVIPR